MARRITKSEGSLIGVLLLVGLPLFAAAKFFEAFGVAIPLAIGAAIMVAIVFAKVAAKKRRRAALLAKYRDPQVVDRIVNKTIWVGQTSAQLLDSLGSPPDIDEKVLKTKKKEIWKYAHRGGNRYGMRITVENDVVIGWDERL